MTDDASASNARTRRPWLPLALAAGLVGLVAYSAWLRYRFLSSSPFPLGIDGYFYPIQLRSLLDTGGLYYPSSPLALYLMAPLAWLTDPIAGARLGAAIGGALIALPAYGVGVRLGGRRAAGLVATAIATGSAGSFYLSVEFVKNGLGVTFGLTFVWLALRALETPTRRRAAAAAAALAAAFLTHKMGAALAVALVGPCALVSARAHGWTARITRRHVVVGIGATVGALAALGALFPERFVAARDLHLFTELFSADAHWDAPAMWLRGGRFVLTMGHEALAGGLTALVALALLAWRWRHLEAPRRALALTVIAFGLGLALPWLAVDDPEGLGFRLRLVAYVPLALNAALVIGLVADLVTGWRPQVVRGRGVALAAVAAVAIAWTLSRPAERREGVVFPDAPMIAAIGAATAYLPPDAIVVVSERFIGFMATYYTEHRVRLRPEVVPVERRWRLITGNFIARHRGLDDALEAARAEPTLTPPRGLHPRHPSGLVLVPEATFTWVLDRVPEATAERLRAWHTI
ncbi:MAG: glycosyltransferase family 39 protein [Kofleriaceae bacterium]